MCITEDKSIDRDTWEYLLNKPDPKFVKDVAVILWGTEGLARRCIDAKSANKGKAAHELRQELTPEKYERLKGRLTFLDNLALSFSFEKIVSIPWRSDFDKV